MRDMDQGTDAAAAVEAVALDEDAFWDLIEGSPGIEDDPDLEGLAAGLAELGADAIAGFEARLTLALWALDSRAAHEWLVEHDPDGLGDVSDDLFLHARCAVVLRGREAWDEAVREQAIPWGDDPEAIGAAEALLYVSDAAARLAGADAVLRAARARIPVSYEMGSNTALWDDGIPR